MTTEPTTDKRPPDHPHVPRQKQGKVLYVLVSLICVAIVGGYAWAAATEQELSAQEHDQIPSGMRSTPGGYRTYSYWHSGYHGGK
jgi:hypothetical protein